MNKLEKLRRQNGFSQTELAQNIGVNQASISKWERGIGLPSTLQLPKLARAFRCTVDDLLTALDVAVDHTHDPVKS